MGENDSSNSTSTGTTPSPAGSSAGPAGLPPLGSPFGQTPADVTAEETKAGQDRAQADREQAQADADRDAAAAAAEQAGAPTDPQAVQGPDSVHRLTVGEGESLDYIADRENVNSEALYRANQGVIEAAAQARGFGGSDNGRLLFPGTLLDLPA